MRWPVFAIFALVMLALEIGLRTLLAIPSAARDGVTPSFVLVLVVFVALSAPAIPALWAALLLGVLVDLTQPLAISGHWGDVAVVGPHALAYVVGAYIVLQIRLVVFRDSPLALAAMVMVIGLIVQVILVAIYTLRGVSWLTAAAIPEFHPVPQLMWRWGVVLYSALLAIPLGFLFQRTVSWWGFASAGKPHTARRGGR